eukprot:15443015-Alexandrium_andersonii.AAC.1
MQPWLIGAAAKLSPSPMLAVGFSGWTAVVSTAVGGSPLLFLDPASISAGVLGTANARALDGQNRCVTIVGL